MKLVLDCPVGAYRCGQLGGGQHSGTDVVTLLQRRLLAVHHSQGIDKADGHALGPGGNIDDPLRRQYRSDLADRSAVRPVNAVLTVDVGAVAAVNECGLDDFEQGRMVALDGEQVIATSRDDLVGDRSLAAHEIERVEQLRNCRDLVAFVGNLLLTENQSEVGGERADHVDRRFVPAARTAHRFAIDPHRAAQGADNAADPLAKGVLELLRIERPEETQEGLFRRNPMLEYQKPTQSDFLRARPENDVLHRIAIRENGRDGDHQNFPEVMPSTVARLAWIVGFAQVVHQVRSVLHRHGLRPKDENRRDSERVYKMLT